ncbi:HpcH/HpaI aldolase family protein [Glutamicibacter uratoxydans]|uniref:HpcH/HpaI aldolase family protein n=1 Tax=Glutamicibacter uratoxydans TaxID=43667 RepID=UPI003D6DFF4C
MSPNQFLKGLRGKQAQVGLWHNLRGVAATEIICASGFDWILLDQEHSPRSLEELSLALGIADRLGTSSIVRVGSHSPQEIGQLLDLGAQSLLVPMVENAEQAESIAKACQFAPQGTRGVSSQTRAGSWGQDKNFLRDAREEICLILQIESKVGADNAEAIIATPGVDAVFIGAADLAASMGHLGNPAHPDVQQVVARVLSQALEADKPVGSLTKSAATASAALAEGYSFVGAGTDSAMLGTTFRALATEITDWRA